MKIGLLGGVLFAVLSLFNCGGEPPAEEDAGPGCDALNCEGCCTDTGECVSGLSASDCGNNGNLCVVCEAPAMCSATGVGGGSCESCSAFNCDGCCTTEGVCEAGTGDDACGYGGQTCVACTGAALCDPRGVGGGICR